MLYQGAKHLHLLDFDNSNALDCFFLIQASCKTVYNLLESSISRQTIAPKGVICINPFSVFLRSHAILRCYVNPTRIISEKLSVSSVLFFSE